MKFLSSSLLCYLCFSINSVSWAQNALPGDPEKLFLEAENRTARQKRLEEKKNKLEKADWVKLALNMTGDSDEISQKAIEQLRAIPKIERLLEKAIQGPYRGLALDSIAALTLTTLSPILLELAAKDEDGFIYQTLNTLLTPENSKTILETYQKRLIDLDSPQRPSGPASLAMIDTLTRLKIPLSFKLMESYLNHEFFETRLMTLRNLQIAIEAGSAEFPKKNIYLPLLKKAFQGKPYQLRLNALFIWQGLSPALQDFSSTYLNSCMRDTQMDLRAECQFTIDRYNQSKEGGKQ